MNRLQIQMPRWTRPFKWVIVSTFAMVGFVVSFVGTLVWNLWRTPITAFNAGAEAYRLTWKGNERNLYERER